jgi:hypothetical protein
VLSNIYLHELDKYMEGQLYIRYVDDILVGVEGSREEGLEILERMSRYLRKELKLNLNIKKTRITRLKTEYLGYSIESKVGMVRSGVKERCKVIGKK